jgi:hypothetical protein
MRRLPLPLLLVPLALAGCDGADDDAARPGSAQTAPPPARPAPPRYDLPRGRGHILARVRRPVLVHTRPGGTPFARLRSTTPFGGPRTLAIFETRGHGRWLAVHSPVLGNGRTGWIENDARRLKLDRTRVSLRIDLSTTTVTLWRGGRVARRVPIAIGRAGTATPPGRFQVTDRMPGSRFPRAPYGCCILALSARQPNLPPGWPGGDRIALHGTPLAATIGTAASNGCLRAADADMRALMRVVPTGAPVTITR